jgi:hypothetical protein
LLTTLLARLVVSAAVTAAVTLAGRRRGASSPALALATGYAVGHALIRGWGWRPGLPLDAFDWLPYLALAAGAAGASASAWRLGPVWAWVGRVGLTGLSVERLLAPIGPASMAFAALVWLAAWWNLAALAERRGPRVAPPLLIVAAGAAVVLGLSGSLVLAALAFVVVASLASAWGVGRSSRGAAAAWGRGAVGVVVVEVAGLLTAGLVYSEVPPTCAALLALAPAAGWVDRPGSRWRGLATVAATAACAAAAVGLAAGSSPPGALS